ncbi:LysR family transcriptional regulator [Terribacillus sp. 179-K 1B1 HS]|uniref:LysR family transcriptional regulator n=1 Tax=Terribacillus sp. 179-K 1B1 HS TaxID=3142388 RepID=UPI0039A3C7F8
MDERDWLILKYLKMHQNITQIASMLYISQPSVTKRLKKMEKYFGASIIEKKNKGIILTAFGHYIVSCAGTMLEEYELVRKELEELKERVSGTLSLGTTNLYAKYCLPAVLKVFKEKYPDVSLEIVTGWNKEIRKAFIHNKIELAIIGAELPDWKGEKQLLFTDKLCIASKERIDIAILPQLPQIHYRMDKEMEDLIAGWWDNNYVQKARISVEVDDIDSCKEMVVQGLGYAILPELALSSHEDIFLEDILLDNGGPCEIHTWIYFEESSLNAASSEFVQMLLNQ